MPGGAPSMAWATLTPSPYYPHLLYVPTRSLRLIHSPMLAHSPPLTIHYPLGLVNTPPHYHLLAPPVKSPLVLDILTQAPL